MNPWKELYTELADIITGNVSEIQWADLWHEQVQYLTAELPFPTPAVFIGFQTLQMDDKGELIQNCNTQVDIYLFYETFSDTYQGSYNQTSAFDFLDSLSNIHALLHGTSGNTYSSMQRIEMRREDTGGAGNLYRISFSCIVEDAGAMMAPVKQEVNELEISRETFTKPSVTDIEPLFDPAG